MVEGLAAAPRGRHGPAPGAVCANCGAALQGPFCHACGQDSDTHKRSIGHLILEMAESLFELDGRLMRTLPDLFLRPGRLARDYLEGRIARHVPPFRTFLVSLLIFIFAAEHATHEVTVQNARQEAARAASLATPQGRAAEAVRMRTKAAGGPGRGAEGGGGRPGGGSEGPRGEPPGHRRALCAGGRGRPGGLRQGPGQGRPGGARTARTGHGGRGGRGPHPVGMVQARASQGHRRSGILSLGPVQLGPPLGDPAAAHRGAEPGGGLPQQAAGS